MISRLLHIVLFCCLTALVSAQIVSPMGYGLPAAPQKLSTYNTGLVAAYENKANEIELQVWNGDFWYKIETPTLPKTNQFSNNNLEILDLLEHNNNVYLVAGYHINNELTSNYLLKWNGAEWTDISNQVISESISLDKLIISNDKIYCVGIFAENNKIYNIVQLENSNWVTSGNYVTRNASQDNFNSIKALNNKVYATGNFTSPEPGNHSLAVWDGSNWELAKFPPFLGENIVLGEYKNQVVVYGKSDFSQERIKLSSGNLWSNLSNGLAQYEIETISQFAELNGYLLAVGEFTNKDNNKTSNILQYNGSEWGETNLNLSNIQSVYSLDKSVVVSGDFSDNARIKYLGNIYNDRAQIAARVYNDRNSNCIKDTNEDWIPNFPITVNSNHKNLITDKFGQIYLPIRKDKYSINATSAGLWTPTCADYEVDVKEYKTYYGAILGVNQQVGVRDASIYIADNQSFNADLDDKKTATLCVTNKGLQPINNATVTLNHTNGVSNFKSTLNYDSYFNNKATWIVNLSGNDKKCFEVSYNIIATENIEIGTQIVLATGQTDGNKTNNTNTIKYKQGSTLVNEKHCDNGKTITPSETQLKYKIGFKNLSDDQALDLKITDELDTDIYISYEGIESFTKHNSTVLPVYTLMDNGNYKTKLIWSFNDINLPSSNISQTESEGFIDLLVNIVPNRIKQGDEICNNAKLYYSYRKGSYNEPIVTNTVCSSVGVTTTIIGDDNSPTYIHGLDIGPNPVSNYLNIANNTNEKYNIVIVNTLGQKMQNVYSIENSLEQIDVSNYSKGVYFIYAKGMFIQKFVVK